METYTRVIPRDFFNEAKLLKCMGLLALKILDCQLPEGLDIRIEESGEPFDIQLTDSGNLHVSNYSVTINDIPVWFGTVYNSKSNYPLVAEVNGQELRVFTETGEFDSEFIENAQFAFIEQ